MSKFRNLKLEIRNSSEAGVTLLFSVLVMSGVSLITMTIGFFVIQELRASRAVALSEPAIGAAESAAEQGLWAMNRGTGLSPCSGGLALEFLTSSQVWSMKCFFNSSALIDVIAGQNQTFHLYDPTNINGNTNPGFTFLLLTYKTGISPVDVTITRIDGSPVVTVPNTPLSINPGSNPVQINLPTNPAEDNRFRVTLSSAGNVTLDVTTNQGMPDFPTVNAEGCMTRSADPNSCANAPEALRRRINIVMPQR
jgi:hypothetical protein